MSFIGGTGVPDKTLARVASWLAVISDHFSSWGRTDKKHLVKYSVRKSMAVMTSLL